MTRLLASFVLVGAGTALSPAAASAQFGYGGPGYYGGPVIAPSFNPFFYVPQYRYQQSFGLNVQSMYGNFSLGTRQYYYGVTNPAWALAPVAPTFYSQSGSSMSGGARPNFALQAQRDLQRAQREGGLPGAAVPNAGGAIGGAINPVPVTERGPNLPEGFEKVLGPAERAKVLSGESLNDLLAAVAKAELRNVDRPSAFVSPLQLEEVRFGGSDAAEALNLALRPPEFPAAFDDPSLKELRLSLAREFAPLATALQAGKAPDAAKRAQFEMTLAKMETALAPVLKNLPFADVTAARRLMNQFANATRAMKAGASNGLIDPKWATEGTTIAELAKHMTRHKLQFASAPAGNEETYTSLHRNFATYLFLLTQPKK